VIVETALIRTVSHPFAYEAIAVCPPGAARIAMTASAVKTVKAAFCSSVIVFTIIFRFERMVAIDKLSHPVLASW
jgi:hypothetical protein